MSGPGSRYVEVPSEAFEAFLRDKGFTRTVRRSEVVYVRRHHRDPRYVVSIFTSIRDGASQARGLGEDAIRVSAFMWTDEAKGQTRGIAKCKRVFRTGSVQAIFERVISRARDAYAVCNQRVKSERPRIALRLVKP